MPARVVEDKRDDPLIDHTRAGAVLDLVDRRVALAFALEEPAHRWRPSEHGHVGEVEDIVKSESVILIGVVAQRIPNWLAVDQKPCSLKSVVADERPDFRCESCREALAFRISGIKEVRCS